jgi:hypothetical protein
MSAIYPSYFAPHSLFKSWGLCTHSPSHYFLSPLSCRSSLSFGDSLNISGLDTLIWHYDSTYPEQLLESSWNLMAHSDSWEGKWRRNWRMEWVASTLTLPQNMVYPALLPLMRTPRLPAVDWTDTSADLNGLVHFAERPNLVSACVPSCFRRSLTHTYPSVQSVQLLWIWYVFVLGKGTVFLLIYNIMELASSPLHCSFIRAD